MTRGTNDSLARARKAWRILPAFAVALLLVSPAGAISFGKGELTFTWDTTISWGAQYRLDDPDPAIIGLASRGNAFSVNGDDGNLNYDTGIFSNVLKLTSEMDLRGKSAGAFVRFRAFYDYENEDGDRLRTPLSKEALKRVGSRADVLDAFVWKKFNLGSRPAEIRIGEQVLSWGESTFIQGGINAINPIDVSAIRVPGAELRDALLPEGLVSAFHRHLAQHLARAVLPLRLGPHPDRPDRLLLVDQRLRGPRWRHRLPRLWRLERPDALAVQRPALPRRAARGGPVRRRRRPVRRRLPHLRARASTTPSSASTS